MKKKQRTFAMWSSSSHYFSEFIISFNSNECISRALIDEEVTFLIKVGYFLSKSSNNVEKYFHVILFEIFIHQY